MVTFYIEGHKSLREGFSVLLFNLLGNSDFQVIMGRSNLETVKKFRHHKHAEGTKYLLVDLDMLEARRMERVEEYNLKNEILNVFFMIQEMEAWFLSQQSLLNEYYGAILKYPTQRACEIEKPSRVLGNITGAIKSKYEKVIHAIDLLKKIDTNQLAIDFIDVKNIRDKARAYHS